MPTQLSPQIQLQLVSPLNSEHTWWIIDKDSSTTGYM